MKLPQVVLLCGLALACATAIAQSDYVLHATPIGPAPVDPAIVRALAAIKPSQIHQTIEKLVSFVTRNTLSSMDTDLPSGQGINAAADWIAGQLEAISHDCGGCLEVKRDTFLIRPAARGGRAEFPNRPKSPMFTPFCVVRTRSRPGEWSW